MNARQEFAADPESRHTRARLGFCAAGVTCLLLALALPTAAWAQAADAPVPAADSGVGAEHERLLRENAALTERLRALEGQQALAERLDAQASRLATLAERLEARLAAVDENGDHALMDEEASLEALQSRLAAAERERQEAEARVTELESRVAELEARLKQQQLTVDEALLRADKAEKLHAALEEAHARVSTENERLSLELATAKERQAEAVQRVLELDSRLETMTARAGAVAPAPVADTAAAVMTAVPTPGSTGASKALAPAQQPAAGSMADGGSKVVYEVRAEDTLSRIAAKVYGDASAWRRIFDANRDVLNRPDELRLGMRLIIP